MAAIGITVEGVRKLLSLNPYKAVGADNLHPRVLKELSSVIAPTLCNSFRASPRLGAVPSDWKLAYVTPIYKKASMQLPENYRPICSKIMEHILVSNIVPFFESQHILNDFQRGFRRFHSCETQLIGLIYDVAKDMQNGGQTDVIVMDFSKAFDKVPHKELMFKLSNYGIDKYTLGWIQNFLSNRQQCPKN